MLIIVSPSKTMDFTKGNFHEDGSIREKTNFLIKQISSFNEDELAKVMKIKGKILNSTFMAYSNFQNNKWKKSIEAYNGAVFKEIKICEYTEEQLSYLNSHLVILSALYGDISPNTLIKEYRLDMTMKILEDMNLYKYWKEDITKNLNNKTNDVLINLASGEFSKLIDRKNFNAKIIDIDFKEEKDGKFKSVSTYAKKARGLMCHYIIINNIQDFTKIKEFNLEGYEFNELLSTESKFVFTR